jgi:hypothetical protein
MEKSTPSSEKRKIEIVHGVRERVRLRIKSDDARELLPDIAQSLRQQAGIKSVTIKEISSSLVVTLDPERISIKELVESLQSFGSVQTSQEREQSWSTTATKLLSVIPPLVGLGTARVVGFSGWKSIITYILAAGITREVIDQFSAPEVELPQTKKVTATNILPENISTLLVAIESDYQIVHHILGRIRLRIPKITSDRNYGRQLQDLLEQDNRITDIRIKPSSGSIVIFYNPKVFSDSNQEKPIFNTSDEQNLIQTVDESENSTPSKEEEKKTEEKKTTEESILTDTPSAKIESTLEQISLISEKETETESKRECSTQIMSVNGNHWSNFKSSMLLTMLQLMSELQVQTIEV